MRRFVVTPILLAAVVPVALSGCDAPDRQPAPLGAPASLPSPAGPASGEPFLVSGTGEAVWLSWLERQDTAHAFRIARLDSEAWSAAHTIAVSTAFFVNWADFPSVFARADGRLVAHWLARSGPGRYAYDVVTATSADGGATWTEPVRPHRDGTQSEHGFVSLFPMADGTVGAVWLDGRQTVGSHGAPVAANAVAGTDVAGNGHADPVNRAMTLRWTTLAADGTPGQDLLIDDRVCDCCQTDVAATADGAVLVYRDRSPEEVRDISVRRLVNGHWSEAAAVHPDGWTIPGCPVNGPSVAARGQAVVVAWFTAARDTAKVNVAFSSDGGASFGPPIRLDQGDPVGRVDVLLLEHGNALVSWLERTAEGALVQVRHVAPDGRASEPTTVTASSAERASGFPRMARAGDRVVFAWTAPGDPARVHAAVAPLPAAR